MLNSKFAAKVTFILILRLKKGSVIFENGKGQLQAKSKEEGPRQFKAEKLALSRDKKIGG